MSEKITYEVGRTRDYTTLAQLYAIINEDFPNKCKAISKVLQGKVNFNYQVPKNKFFTSIKPQLVGHTALHFALGKHDLDVFKQLLKYVDLNIEDNEGATVLDRAIEKSYLNHRKCWELKGRLEHPFVNAVLSAYVKLNDSRITCNKYGISNFHIACMMNHVEAIEFFVKHGIPVDLDVNATSTVLPGYSALHFAARYCSLQAAKVLIELGADVYRKDAKGFTPLHVIIKRTLQILDCINLQKQRLCKKFTDELETNREMIRMIFNRMKSDADDIGLTVLHIACILDDAHMAAEVIPNISINNSIYKDSPFLAGYTALHIAAHVSMDMVMLLIRYSASIFSEDVSGVTPLTLCIERFTVVDVHCCLITSQSLCRMIKFSDAITTLSDVLLAMQDEQSFKSLLATINSNVIIPRNSPLWPGYSILHLAIFFCHRVNKKENIYNSTDYFEVFVSESEYLLRLFKNDYEEEKKKLYYRRIKQILRINANLINFKDASGTTPLHLAFRLQNRSVVRLLLKYRTNINNNVDADGLSHLYIACAMGNEILVEKLLRQNVNVNFPVTCNIDFLLTNVTGSDYSEDSIVLLNTPGWTPLHLAVVTNHANLVKILLKYGADINVCDAEGLTPVHRVLQLNDYYQVGETLLSVDILKDCVTSFGLSYLHIACLVGVERQVKSLLDLGVDIETVYSLPKDSNDASDGKHVAERFKFLKKFVGYTPLHIATMQHHIKVIYFLFERGANIFASNANGSVLGELLFSKEFNFSRKFMVEFDYENKNKFLEQLNEKVGLTQLHLECFDPGQQEVIRILTFDKANVNTCTPSDSPVWPQKTALHFLVMCMIRVNSSYSSSHEDDTHNILCENLQLCAEWLLQCGADVTLGDINQLTPIHLATELLFWGDGNYYEQDSNDINDENGDGGNIKDCYPSYILAGQKNFKINPVDFRGMSHFHIACAFNQVPIVKKFLKHGVNIHSPVGYFCKRYAGYTPLHLAAYHKCAGTVALLLKNGACANAKDSFENTPLHVAAQCCQHYSNIGSCLMDEKIFKMLINAGAHVDSLNLWGETPLSVFMRTGLLTKRGIDIFVRDNNCCINVFNMKNGEGFLALTLSWYCGYGTFKKSIIYKRLLSDRSKNNVDSMGRTVIHNIVSSGNADFTSEWYTATIEELIVLGFDIDHQDKRGWTALHAAAYFGNCNGVIGLLKNGADVNWFDLDNKSAIIICREGVATNIHYLIDIPNIFALLVYKLEIARLEISRDNQEIMSHPNNGFFLYEDDIKRCNEELQLLKSQKIATTSFTWFDLLSRTDASLNKLRTYPHALAKIRKIKAQFLHKKFSEFDGLLIMRLRQAFLRMELTEPAKNALKIIFGLNFPDLCAYYVIQLLKNKDLEQLIKAVKENASELKT